MGDGGQGETRGRQGQQGHGRCRGEGPRKPLWENVADAGASSPFSTHKPSAHCRGCRNTGPPLHEPQQGDTEGAGQPSFPRGRGQLLPGRRSGTRLRPLAQAGAVLWQCPGRSSNVTLLDPETLSPVLSWGRCLKGHPGTSEPTQRSRSQTAPSTGQESLLQLGTRERVAACYADFAFPLGVVSPLSSSSRE